MNAEQNRDFPHKSNINFLAFCSVSPLNGPASRRVIHGIQRQTEVGRGMLFEFVGEEHIASRFHRNFAQLMKTSPENITMTTNTSQPLGMIANGYPFEPGDEIISYINEYPANHYPWVIQNRRRGVKLHLLSDVDVPQEDREYTEPVSPDFARGWSFDELESLVNERTRMIAISHVQFTSGYAADLPRLGEFCKSKNIDLVVDAAQGMGCLPLYPEQWNISAVAAAGWKWMMGPVGTGVLYTSPDFRDKIEITMSGADQMKQDTEYLDHTWDPHSTGQKFEYSTVTYAALDGLSVGIEELFLPRTLESIRDRNFELQELALKSLDVNKYQPVVLRPKNRSGILSLIPNTRPATEISTLLDQKNIIITPRDGYLRFAPHFCSTEQEVQLAVQALNEID